jgi:hypothetical protein
MSNRRLRIDNYISQYLHVRNLRNYFHKTRVFIDNLFSFNNRLPTKKIKIANNKPLTDQEFSLVEKICDIYAAISELSEGQAAPPQGGKFWSEANKGNGPFDLHLRKNRSEIDHSFLFNTRFRDFPAMAYEHDEYSPKPDFWVTRYQQLASAVPKKWRVRIPARFGEIGWNVSNFPVNRLTGINQERVHALHLTGVVRYLEEQKSAKIMEIGAGSGELGYVLCDALPNCTWFDCDLVRSLVYSTIHLAVLLPEKSHYIYVGNLDLGTGLDESLIIRSAKEAAKLENAVINIPNFLLKDFLGHLDLHLAYNTYSFAEMPPSAVVEYAEILDDLLKEQGVLFEQNGNLAANQEDSVESILSLKFKKQILKWNFDLNPTTILSGANNLWSNNTVTKDLYNKVAAYQVYKITYSMNHKQEFADVPYPQSAWNKVAELFPNCI